MEKYIGFVIVLFFLSMICERVSDFLKHSLGEKNTFLSVFIVWMFRIGDTLGKGGPNSEQEEERYFRILKINIFCGFWIAFALHADLFSILGNIENPWLALTWENYHFESFWLIVDKDNHNQPLVLFILGCLGTGLFISFGSKFWHDLLDLLLQVKNLRRKLVDQRSYQYRDNIRDFDAFVAMPESGLSRVAMEQYEDEIRNMEGVLSVGPGFMDAPGGKIGCLEVHLLSDQYLNKVSNSYSVRLLNGEYVSVPVNKIVTGKTVLQNSIRGAGMLIANQSKVYGWGSTGCVVRKKNSKDKSLYLLSCYHVMSANKDLSQLPDQSMIYFKSDEDEVAFGTVVEGVRDVKMDAAIAKIIIAGIEFNNDMILNPKKIRKVTSTDVTAETIVRVFGGESKMEKLGIIFNHTWKEPFDYPDKPKFEIEDLLVLTHKAGGRLNGLTIEGDSGSLVIDNKTNEVLGMIVGGNAAFSFAIKMTAIEKQFAIELI